ncbi:MAG: glycosyltransferase family 8 protein [Firmicutes bacterium]|nr:glycosyltransferase family 8 protein [Bacillota bacterium]
MKTTSKATPKNNIVPIFYAVDDNYAALLHASIQSVTSQASPKYEYHINILCENLSDKWKKSYTDLTRNNIKVMVHDMTKLCKERGTGFHVRDYYSKTTYFRIFIPTLFPEYSKAIYLDSDMILNADISELYNHDLDNNYAAACCCETCNSFDVWTKYVEIYLGFKLPWYFNAGMLVLNLDLLRKDNFEAKFFDILGKVKFEVIQDQDYLNCLFRGRVLFLPQTWNKIPLEKPGIDESNVKLVHFNLIFRPWRYDNVPFEAIFWKHAKQAPKEAYQALLDEKKNYGDDKKAVDKSMFENLQKLAISHWDRPIEDTWAGQYFMGKIKLMK